jgi:hypothetical protein
MWRRGQRGRRNSCLPTEPAAPLGQIAVEGPVKGRDERETPEGDLLHQCLLLPGSFVKGATLLPGKDPEDVPGDTIEEGGIVPLACRVYVTHVLEAEEIGNLPWGG